MNKLCLQLGKQGPGPGTVASFASPVTVASAWNETTIASLSVTLSRLVHILCMTVMKQQGDSVH